jgi:ABC-type transporter Mla subunit MlaD
MSVTVQAELAAAAEALERHRTRITGLLESTPGLSADLASAMYEIERSLLGVHRLVVRAEKISREENRSI